MGSTIVSGRQCLSDSKAQGQLTFTLSDIDGDLGSIDLVATSSNTKLVPSSGLTFGGVPRTER
jgi:hypothetical protein